MERCTFISNHLSKGFLSPPFSKNISDQPEVVAFLIGEEAGWVM
jgi:hypothetical protein